MKYEKQPILIFTFIFVILTFVSVNWAQAMIGGDSSGGGDLIKDTRNPWFLTNTKEVRYCIEYDKVNFGLQGDRLQELIEKAIDFWVIQFQDVDWTNFGAGEMNIGKHQYTLLPNCDQSADLRFQFGVLSPEQQSRFLSEPKEVVGTVIRTDYDKINLKGKGFIYISPQAGLLKMEIPGLREETWSFYNGAYLFPVLIHEIGHIFGIQHDPADFIMKASAPEEIVIGNRDEQDRTIAQVWQELIEKNEFQYLRLYKFNDQNSFFSSVLCAAKSPSNPIPKIPKPKKASEDQFISVFDKYFELETSEMNQFCVKYEFSKGQFNFYFGPNNNSLELIGHAELEKAEAITRIGYPTRLVEMWLPKEQTVYDLGPYLKNETVISIGWINKISTFKGEWINHKTGTKHVISIIGEAPQKMTVGGILDGKFYFDLNFGF